MRPRFRFNAEKIGLRGAASGRIWRMKSMTGYGRGEASRDGIKITTEITSVNRKQSEITVYLPREIESLEAQARAELNKRIARGRVTVKVALHAAEALPGQVQVNVAVAKAYASELRKLAKDLKLTDTISVETLVRLPGVLGSPDEISETAALWPILEESLVNAMDALLKMRMKEGAHLSKDLQGRIKAMRNGVAKVKKVAPEMVKRYRDALAERIKNAGLPLPPEEDERLLKEVVYFADRSDISEELARLQSHFNQFEDCVKTEEPVGRTLDFLAQEMNREINTIGSKAQDSEIAREVVLLKAELEKFREQVQNVE
jgi:uncharacterized protein (TIGR00255 family)